MAAVSAVAPCAHRPLNGPEKSMCRRACVVGVVALALTVTTPAFGAMRLSKATARQVAVTVAAQRCRTLDWCVNVEVAPVKSCRRVRDVVYCGIAFVTVDQVRCTGVVAVKKAPSGRIDHGMAVPMDCGAGAP
jgi:hypothetical protein